MSVIPISNLSRSDLHALGNNLTAAVGRDRCTQPAPVHRAPFAALAAVNRSLAAHGEQVATLYRFHSCDTPRQTLLA